MREGRWKYFLPWDGNGELYDILADPAEAKNVAEQYPEVAADLEKKVLAFKAELPKQVESTGKYKHQY